MRCSVTQSEFDFRRSHGLALPATCLSLFSGGGGLDLGLRMAIPSIRTVCYVEREAYAAATLVARMASADLDPAPVWDDVATFDGHPWRGRVDLIAGGFPCQDISCAGMRAGLDGERSGLWREYARLIAEGEPRLVFIENVAALRSRGLDRVLADLAALGFDAEWTTLGARDVGAPHRRERIFILAHADRERQPQPGGTVGEVGRRAGDRGEAVGDADGAGLEGRSLRDGGRSGERAPWPPGPEDADGWSRVRRDRPDLEPAVRRVADGLANRVERLRLLGNGVVPAQAAAAWRELWGRLSM